MADGRGPAWSATLKRALSAFRFAQRSTPYALTAVTGACGALAAAHYRALPTVRLPDMGALPPDDTLPFVSIVVPARDEGCNLPVLLRSLLALDYPHFEVIVVDDASTDATGAVAQEYAAPSSGRLRVLTCSGPESGWTGKTFACALGARAARGDWLLFTDADTEHHTASLRVAIQMARIEHVRALSLFPHQRCVTFWERLLLPFAYQQYFVGVSPRTRSRPGGPALANGQYFLIARDAYEAAGGHGSVASSIVEDVALAGALTRSGYSPLVCRGGALVQVRMYSSWRALAEGFTKNSAQFVRHQRRSGALVVLSTACSAAILPALLGAIRARDRRAFAAAIAAYALQALGLLPWERDFAVPRRYALLGPLAALGFTAIALSSAFHTLTERPVRWKGRAYRASGAASSRSARFCSLPEVRLAPPDRSPRRRLVFAKRSDQRAQSEVADRDAASSPASSRTRPPRLTLRRIWRALRAPEPDERPPGVPRLRYRVPVRWLTAMGRDLLLGRSRSFRDDCALAVCLLPRAPIVDGLEHVPASGSVILIANHYQRRDLWIGWPGALLCHALWTARPDLSCHYVTTDRAVIGGATVPGTRWLFGRVARVWDFVPVTPPEALDAAPTDAHRALRRCLRLLRRSDGRPVCLILFPEGTRGSTRGLGAGPPGNGRSLLALAATGAPILPAAVWEEPGGALHARFGPPWHPHLSATASRDLDCWAADEATARIAALLPLGLRGHYAGVCIPRTEPPSASATELRLK